MQHESFLKYGWALFPFDPILRSWVSRTLPAAQKAVNAPNNQQWLRCGGTWFAGVNVLGNDTWGAVNNGPVLAGNAVEFIRQKLELTKLTWDQGQVSVCYPGYPKPMKSETEAAFRYRLNRDAAHVDGLLPEGTERRRHLREYHGFILGIPMVETSPDASPIVVWEGSHEITRKVFKQIYEKLPPESWGDIDVTDVYQDIRREIFETCKRVKVFANPGEAYIVHRLALHGISVWRGNAKATEDGRMICYFRPEIGNLKEWLHSP